MSLRNTPDTRRPDEGSTGKGTPAQRAGVRRTVAILVVVAVAAYALFLYSATRGGM